MFDPFQIWLVTHVVPWISWPVHEGAQVLSFAFARFSWSHSLCTRFTLRWCADMQGEWLSLLKPPAMSALAEDSSLDLWDMTYPNAKGYCYELACTIMSNPVDMFQASRTRSACHYKLCCFDHFCLPEQRWLLVLLRVILEVLTSWIHGSRSSKFRGPCQPAKWSTARMSNHNQRQYTTTTRL